MVERVCFIHGMSSYIDKCCSIECRLYLEAICQNKNYQYCYPYDIFIKNEKEIQEIIYERASKSPHFNDISELIVRQV